MSFILADGWLITMNERREVLEKGSIYVDQDRILAISTRPQLEKSYPAAEVVDCGGHIVMPGMVNTHTHLFQTLLKGLGDDMVLKKWFTCMTGPSAIYLTPEDAHAAAMHGCVESIRSGVTTLVDFMYAHPRPGMIKSVVEAFEATGMRGFVCRGFISLGEEYGVPKELIEKPEDAMADARQQIRTYNRPGARIQIGLAPNMIWAVDESGYRQTRKLADEEHVLITTHVAETSFELQTSAALYGRTDTEFLSDIGFLARMSSLSTACNARRTTSASCIITARRYLTIRAAICISLRAAHRSRRCCGRASWLVSRPMGRQAAITTAFFKR